MSENTHSEGRWKQDPVQVEMDTKRAVENLTAVVANMPFVSELLRRPLGLSTGLDDTPATELERSNGFDVFPGRVGSKATIEAVQQLCREEGT